MRKLIKIFAIWLIAIAIPTQGLASIAMMNCERLYSHQSQNATTDNHLDQHNEHSMSAEHAHDTLQTSDNASQGTDKSKHACAHCVKCTTCCSGFTFQTTSSNLFQQLNAGEIRFSYNTLLFSGFIPSGLERPPRFTLT